jgi:serine phosphatase RsbU (regulator of sigma subunit)
MRLKAARMKYRFQRLKEFYSLYTSGLSHKEIEQLLKKDTLEAYAYYKRKTRVKDQSLQSSSPRKILLVIREIFFSFIMKLTPARRLVYGIGTISFLWGLVQVDFGYIIAAFLLINFLLALELADKLTTRDELEIAREIQINLQPVHLPELQHLSISAYSRPARIVGGDFFNLVQPEKDKVIGILGDVSDKGISAALYAAYFQSMFESLAARDGSPALLMRHLNELITKRLRTGDFITAVIAMFDLAEKSVTIVRAGHNWPLYYHAETAIISELKPKGMSIGVLEDEAFYQQIEEQKLYLNPGDLVLLYSDGVTEATAPDDRMFALAGLKSVVQESVHESSKGLIAQITLKLDEFMQGNEPGDDATMMAIKIR